MALCGWGSPVPFRTTKPKLQTRNGSNARRQPFQSVLSARALRLSGDGRTEGTKIESGWRAEKSGMIANYENHDEGRRGLQTVLPAIENAVESETGFSRRIWHRWPLAMRFRPRQGLLLLFGMTVSVCWWTSTAAVPNVFSYQGKLSNSSGAVTNGIYQMVFRLFSQELSGEARWSETNQVRVTEGVFATLLGQSSALSADVMEDAAFLEVEVNNGILSPRTKLASTPFALRAATAERLPEGAILPSMLAPKSVTSVALADGAVETASLSKGSVTGDKLATDSVDSSKITDGSVEFPKLSASAVSELTTRARSFDKIYSVVDFGAVGDGKADDSQAFKNTLSSARRGALGAKVIVPPGTYRITSTLSVENVLLCGLEAGGWSADTGPLPRLKVDFTNAPCIIAKAGASIHGLSFEYDHAGIPARKFAPAVQLSGVGISLSNLRLNEPYDGFVADGTSNIGRLNIANVFMINARHLGLYVTGSADASTIQNVEVWNYIDYSLGNCVAFKFGYNDELRLVNCFAFDCLIGFNFVEVQGSTTWGGMANCSSDFCQWGIQINAARRLRIGGGSHWSHWSALKLLGRGSIVVSGADLASNGDNNVYVGDCDSLTLTGCSLEKSGTGFEGNYMINMKGGKSANVSGCTFDSSARGILIQASMPYFAITGNVFQSSTNAPITDNSSATAMKVIANNLMNQIHP